MTLPLPLVILLAIAAPAGAYLAIWWWLLVRPRPRRSGRLRIQGLSGTVRIRRDGRAVPHIQAGSLADACTAQGWVHVQDRLWQMELARRTASGRLAELFGPRALPVDRFMRRVGLRAAAEREAAALHPGERLLLAAYATGVNAGLAGGRGRRPPELRLFGITPEPWTAVDTLAIGKLMALELAANLDAELMRAALVDRLGVAAALGLEHADRAALGTLAPQPAWQAAVREAMALYAAARAELARQGGGGGGGSNAFAVAGRFTASGKPMLASDPHLALSLPAIWHEVHLLAPGIDVYGAALPGAPLVLMGHTPALAWGLTNAYADCQDAVLERLSADGTRVETAGGPVPVSERAERIAVRGGADVVERCRASRHGPFLAEAGGQALALAWTALEPGHTFTAIGGLIEAGGIEAALSALEHWHAPAQTVVLADSGGRIARVLAGTIPRRGGRSGALPVAGWLAAPVWDGRIPPHENPREIDPPEGLIVSANERPEPCLDDCGWDFPAPYRAQRIRTRLTQASQERKLTVLDLHMVQLDVVSIPGRLLGEALKAATPAHEPQRILRELLAGWDGELYINSSKAAAYQVLVSHLARAAFSPLLGPELTAQLLGQATQNPLATGTVLLGRWTGYLVRSLKERDAALLAVLGLASWDGLLSEACASAYAELCTLQGTDWRRWRWGELHRLHLAHPLARGGGVLAWLFGSRSLPQPGDGDTPRQAALQGFTGYAAASACASWRQVVDLGARASSGSVIPGGQWGIPHSRHYLDQLKTWNSVGLLGQNLDQERLAAEHPQVVELLPG